MTPNEITSSSPRSSSSSQSSADEPNAAARRVEDAISPLVESFGFEVVMVEWVGSSPRHRILRVYLDLLDGGETLDTQTGPMDRANPPAESSQLPSADVGEGSGRGITLEQCVEMSRIIGHELDAAEEAGTSALASLLSSPYTLEVSSPGLERPLARLRHFRRFLGSEVTVRTVTELVPGTRQRKIHGELLSASADPRDPEDPRKGSIVLRERDSGTEFAIDVTNIARANLVFGKKG